LAGYSTLVEGFPLVKLVLEKRVVLEDFLAVKAPTVVQVLPIQRGILQGPLEE
jgi:hypothetical protein